MVNLSRESAVMTFMGGQVVRMNFLRYSILKIHRHSGTLQI